MLLGSIQQKLFLLRIGIGALIGLAIGLSSYLFISDYIIKEQSLGQQRDNHLITQLVYAYLKEHADMTVDIATGEKIGQYLTTYREAFLEQSFEPYKDDFAALAMLDMDGQEVQNYIDGHVSYKVTNIGADPTFQRAVKSPGQLIISPPQSVPFVVGDVVQFYYYYTDFFEKKHAVIRTSVSLEDIEQYFEGNLLLQDRELLVIDQNGLVVVSSQERNAMSNIGIEILQNSVILSEILSKDSFFGNTNVSGEIRQISSFAVPEYGWRVLLFRPLDEMKAPIRKIRNYIIVVSMLVIVLGELFSRLIGLSLVEPITRLLQLTHSISKSGDLSKRVEWKSKDELGELAASFNDMLDRLEEAQVNLNYEKNFTENIIQSMVDGLLVVDDKGQVEKVNQAALVLMNWTGQSLQRLHETHLFPDLHVLEHDQIHEVETTLRLDGETDIPVALSLAKLHAEREGEQTKRVILVKDLREKKLMEEKRLRAETKLHEVKEELLQTEKLAIVGQMSGMVAHEVLNPISAISVRISLNKDNEEKMGQVVEILENLTSDWSKQLETGSLEQYCEGHGERDIPILKKIATVLVDKQKERQEDFLFLDRQIHRVIKIVDGLREMSKSKKELAPIDLKTLVSEVISDMVDGIRKRNIREEIHLLDDLVIRADHMEMYSIFSNLIKNSIHAIDKNTQNKEKTIRINMQTGQDRIIYVFIEDSGIGIPPDLQETIFETGFTNKGREGTGLGLSYARKIARQYHGDITLIKSDPGVGTTFLVQFDLKEAVSEQPVVE